VGVCTFQDFLVVAIGPYTPGETPSRGGMGMGGATKSVQFLISVDDALLMCCFEGFGNLQGYFEDSLKRRRPRLMPHSLQTIKSCGSEL
jgi:hypothetical protein